MESFLKIFIHDMKKFKPKCKESINQSSNQNPDWTVASRRVGCVNQAFWLIRPKTSDEMKNFRHELFFLDSPNWALVVLTKEADLHYWLWDPT